MRVRGPPSLGNSTLCSLCRRRCSERIHADSAALPRRISSSALQARVYENERRNATQGQRVKRLSEVRVHWAANMDVRPRRGPPVRGAPQQCGIGDPLYPIPYPIDAPQQGYKMLTPLTSRFAEGDTEQ